MPSAAQALNRFASRLSSGASPRQHRLLFLDLPRRVAKVLLNQAKMRMAAFRVKLRQEELAHQAGGTRQSVNAALRSFQRRGWIQVHDRAVTLTEAAALARFAGISVSA